MFLLHRDLIAEARATPLLHRTPTLATLLSTLVILVSSSSSSPSSHPLSPPLLGLLFSLTLLLCCSLEETLVTSVAFVQLVPAACTSLRILEIAFGMLGCNQ